MARWRYQIFMALTLGLKMFIESQSSPVLPRFHGYGLTPSCFFHGSFHPNQLVVASIALCLGTAFTWQRLKALDWPRGLCMFLLVPVGNLLFICLLCLITSEAQAETGKQQYRFWPRSERSAASMAILMTLLGGLAIVLTLIFFFETYAWSLFLVTPFFVGLFVVLLYTRTQPADLKKCTALARNACAGMALMMLALALEGIICLVMAAVPAILLAHLGGYFGWLLQKKQSGLQQSCLLLMGFLPLSVYLDLQQEAPVLPVVTEVQIQASPEQVWSKLIAFPPIPEPKEWLFLVGIAYPTHATIEGDGVGALRYCHFSTGPFVEPITAWEPPERLAFSVREQPRPMTELSPYETVHAPHLDGYLQSTQGELKIIPLADGKVLLRGTTWYRQKLGPQFYWRLWSDMIIHKIHLRVLNHIKNEAEQGARKPNR